MKSKTIYFAIFVAATTIRVACAQAYEFSEVPAGLSLFSGATAYSVNDKGEFLVVYANLTGPNSAFIFNGQKSIAVKANAGEYFLAYNTPGYVLGFAGNVPFLQDSKGKRTNISGPTGIGLAPSNLNNKNVLFGGGNNAQSVQFGLVWNNGVVTQYSYPDSSTTYFNGGNDLGDIAGTYTTAGDPSFLGFLISKSGKTSSITIPGYANFYPAMVNNSGLLVGDAYNNGAPSVQVGFYKAKGGTLKTFDFAKSAPIALPGPKGPLSLQPEFGINNVWGLNNLGWICGSYVSSYEDQVLGYAVAFPIVGKP